MRPGAGAPPRGMLGAAENPVSMATEPISPELALVDPELGARARAALPSPAPSPTAPVAKAHTPVFSQPEPAPAVRHYPAWARITAALWLLVIGILVGGAAIPHAQDRPRVIPRADDVTTTVCMPSTRGATAPPPRARLGR